MGVRVSKTPLGCFMIFFTCTINGYPTLHYMDTQYQSFAFMKQGIVRYIVKTKYSLAFALSVSVTRTVLCCIGVASRIGRDVCSLQ
ncbi:hypothetical protein F5Y16DRAFT_166308 [Xylariaceae sp. FL0255]|nr:hypothetical protein F5Y16DRAFT_166308 [Xylariaceae sp. FL0255]